MGIPPRVRYVPSFALNGNVSWAVWDRDNNRVVPDSEQTTWAEAKAMADILNEVAAREPAARPSGSLTRPEFEKALKDLRGKLREASLTTERAELRDILEELQHLTFAAKTLVMNGGVWEPGE